MAEETKTEPVKDGAEKDGSQEPALKKVKFDTTPSVAFIDKSTTIPIGTKPGSDVGKQESSKIKPHDVDPGGESDEDLFGGDEDDEVPTKTEGTTTASADAPTETVSSAQKRSNLSLSETEKATEEEKAPEAATQIAKPEPAANVVKKELAIPRKSPNSTKKTVTALSLNALNTGTRMNGTAFGLPAGVNVPPSIVKSKLLEVEMNTPGSKLMDVLKSLPTSLINDALTEYDDAVEIKGASSIRNHGAYLYGVVKRYVSVHERSMSGEGTGILPMGEEGLTAAVETKLNRLVTTGFCSLEEMNEKIKNKIRMLPEKEAIFALDELASVERSSIRNFGSYFMGILNRYMRGDMTSKIRPPQNNAGSHTSDRSRGPSSRDRFARDNNKHNSSSFRDRSSSFEQNRRGSNDYNNLGPGGNAYRNNNNHDNRTNHNNAYGNRPQPSWQNNSAPQQPQPPSPMGYPLQMSANQPPPPIGSGMPPMGGPSQLMNHQQSHHTQPHNNMGMPGMQPTFPPQQQQPPPGPYNMQQQPPQQHAPQNSYNPHQQQQPPMNYQHNQNNGGVYPSPQQQNAPSYNNTNMGGQPPYNAMNQPNQQNQYGNVGNAQPPQPYQQQQNHRQQPPPPINSRPGGWQQQQQNQSQMPVDIMGLANKAASAIQALGASNSMGHSQQNNYPSSQQPPQQQQQTGYNAYGPPGGNQPPMGQPPIGQPPQMMQQQQQPYAPPPQQFQSHPPQQQQQQQQHRPPYGRPGGQGGQGAGGGRRRTTATLSELPLMVQYAVQNLVATGAVDGQPDEGILGMIIDLPEDMCLAALQKFASIDKTTMRNKTAYLAGLLRRELEKINRR